MVTSDQKINVVRTGQKLGEPLQRQFSTNPSKQASLCNDLLDVLRVGGIHQNGKYLKTISREGRKFPAPALLQEVGMERMGSPGGALGTLCAERGAHRSADVLPMFCRCCCCSLLFWVTETCDGGCVGICSQATRRRSWAKPFRLTLIEGSDSAVTVAGGRVGEELAMGFAPVVARAESALRSLSQNDDDQASLAVTWLITLY